MIYSELNNAFLSCLNRYEKGQICIVADKNLIRHKEWMSARPLQELPVLWLKVNEADKSIETVMQIWDFLLEHELTRRGLLLCIGGGVLTDTCGFAAATYKRGIDYINVPTTLLGMIDASSGGKTGINYRGLKNAIGVFANPVETIIYPGWLTTLPSDQFLSGFGEMLKTGLITNCQKREGSSLWERLLQYDLETMEIQSLTPLIESCVLAKEEIVNTDPHERGLRKILNFGHTFGHALEEIQMNDEPSKWPHGYAVLYGLIAELYLSVVKLGCPKAPLQQLTQVMLHYYGKPQCKCSDYKRLIGFMKQDKKNEHADEINCTLIRAVGSPVINQKVSENEAKEAFDYLFSL